MPRRRVVVGLCAAALAGCAHREPAKGLNPPVAATRGEPEKAQPPRPRAADPRDDPKQLGLATWYGPGFAGKKTSSGERFDPHALTAAHRRLPFGTWVEVRRVDTGRAVRVRINDRGPWGDSRKVIDLSRRAAEMLEMIHEGSVRVEVRVVR